ncbi:MAG: MBL fold metallo-hydrolase [Bdellovibrionota bacterium]
MKNFTFHQLFERESSTYTYLLADADSLEAVIIDPVLETSARDLQLIQELGLKLLYILETHIHADHITGAAKLSDATGAQIAVSGHAQATGANLFLKDGDVIPFGRHRLKALSTPGHTDSCMCFYMEDRVFTGDALMIRGTGRTDFQQGCAPTLFKSVTSKLFTLPEDTLVYPGHDYKGFTSSTIGSEKRFNCRLGHNHSMEDFIKIMSELKLDQPKKIDVAVPANLKCGRV